MYPVKKPKSKAWMIWIAVIILPILLCVCLLATRVVTFTLEANGPQQVEIDYGRNFIDPGARMVLRGGKLFAWEILPGLDIQSTGIVDSNTVGRYTVTYSTNILWWKVSGNRQVNIVDRLPPIITLLGNENATTEQGLSYTEEGFLAVDEYEGDLTHLVQRTEENGAIIYRITDSSGNTATAERTIQYNDTLPPEIHLEGNQTMTIELGEPYREPGYTAWDLGDGDVTDQIRITGSVNTDFPGTYTISYTVSDGHGNESKATRIVTVVAGKTPENPVPSEKVVYLTFDDGPSVHTSRLLKILEQYNVKATFFVVGNNKDLMKEIVSKGHSIGIHSVTHNYRQIYSSSDAYFMDLDQMQENILEATGVRTHLVRFPGGSSNTVSCFNDGIMTILTQAVEEQGFQYFDWNVDSNDAGGAKDRETVFHNVINGIQQHNISVVLQHDTQGFSVDAVEDIIQWGLANGYTFLPLTEESADCHHRVNN